MDAKIHTVHLPLDFKLMNDLSTIDRFGGEWKAIAKREGVQTLKELRSIATVQSTGASTRIEGSKMTNDEVKHLIENLTIEKLEERDKQEVKGYFNVLNIIIDAFSDIDISENSIKNLHNQLLKFSDKDQWHKGDYKQNSNSVERTNPDGSKTIIFETTPPGIETENAMRDLIEWYNSDNSTPAIIKSAIFVYDFVSIHPFQDGNGRLSRLLGTLLLLKHGYPWIQYVSFEHEVEGRKPEYYQVLMECQHQRPGENIYSWVIFFVNCLHSIQGKLMQKIESQKRENQLSPREKLIYHFIDHHPGTKSGIIAEKLGLELPTVKRKLGEMVTAKFLSKHGIGKGTSYTAVTLISIKSDIIMKFTNEQPTHEYTLFHRNHFIEIKKVILTPKFNWKKPDDWSKKLFEEGLTLTITCYNQNGKSISHPYRIDSHNDPTYFQPIFTLNAPINVPINFWEGLPMVNEYPIKVELEIQSNLDQSEFDVELVYDAMLE